jgi:hypothetical protein
MKAARLQAGAMGSPFARHRFACCDCGLVHDREFEIGDSDRGEEGVIIFRARRNNRATAATRRYMKIGG